MTPLATPLDVKTAIKIVDFLNNLLEYDRAAVEALINTRVDCSDEMANHPTVQVRSHGDGNQHRVGLLGILNGLCGIKKNGYGLIVAEFNDHKAPKRLKRFYVNTGTD